MDSHYIDPSVEDSHQSRSRSNSHLSSTTSRFQDLDIKSTISSTEQGGGTSTEDPESHPASTSTFTAEPEQYTPFPQFSQSDIDAHWSCLPATEDRTGPTPLLRLDPAEHLSSTSSLHSHPSLSRSHSFPANMRYVRRRI
jgi:hypothetical protein